MLLLKNGVKIFVIFSFSSQASTLSSSVSFKMPGVTCSGLRYQVIVPPSYTSFWLKNTLHELFESLTAAVSLLLE